MKRVALLPLVAVYCFLCLVNAPAAFVVDNKLHKYVVGNTTNWITHNIAWAVSQVHEAGGGEIRFNIEGAGPWNQGNVGLGVAATLTGAANVTFQNVAMAGGSTVRSIVDATSLTVGPRSTVNGVNVGTLTAGDDTVILNSVVRGASTLSGEVEGRNSTFRGNIAAENLFLTNSATHGTANISGVAAFGGVSVSGRVNAVQAAWYGVRTYRDVIVHDDSSFHSCVIFRDLTVGDRAQFTRCTINGEYLRVGNQTTIDHETTMLVQKEFQMGSSNVFLNYNWFNFALVLDGSHNRIENCGSFLHLHVNGDYNELSYNMFERTGDISYHPTNQILGDMNKMLDNTFDRRVRVVGSVNTLQSNNFLSLEVVGWANELEDNTVQGALVLSGDNAILRGNVFRHSFNIVGDDIEVGGDEDRDRNYFVSPWNWYTWGSITGDNVRVVNNRFGVHPDGTAITNEYAMDLRFSLGAYEQVPVVKNNIFVKQRHPVDFFLSDRIIMSNNVFGVLDDEVYPTAGLDAQYASMVSYHQNQVEAESFLAGNEAWFSGNRVKVNNMRFGTFCQFEPDNSFEIGDWLHSHSHNEMVGFSFSNTWIILTNGYNVLRDSTGAVFSVQTHGVSNRVADNLFEKAVWQGISEGCGFWSRCHNSEFSGNTFITASVDGTGTRVASNLFSHRISVRGAGHQIAHNWVGLTLDGEKSATGGHIGVYSATNVLLRGNTVVGSTDDFAVNISSCDDVKVYGNSIGLFNGTVMTNAQDGIIIRSSSGISIGGDYPEDRNIIVGSRRGIWVSWGPCDDIRIHNNFIGVGPDGRTAIPNREAGVQVGDFGSNHSIQGSVRIGCDVEPLLRRNVIAGNLNHNIRLLQVRNVDVYANHLGVDVDGTTIVSSGVRNPQANVSIEYSDGVFVGNQSFTSGNIMGGANHGIYLEGAGKDIWIMNNRIGCDFTGLYGLPNGVGIRHSGFHHADLLIRDNIISGNSGHAIQLDGPHSNVDSNEVSVILEGNIIGLDMNQQFALPNAWSGFGVPAIMVRMSHVNIGGTKPNIIAANQGYGIRIARGEGTQVHGNFIGLSQYGDYFPNRLNGVNISTSSNRLTYNSIMGNMPEPQFGRVGAGVSITDPNAQFNTLLNNAIWGHLEKGIHIQPGANESQAFPVITNYTRDAQSIGVLGYVQSKPNSRVTVQFFINRSLNPAGRGEGEMLVGTMGTFANAEGRATVVNTIFYSEPQHIVYLTTTATSADGSTSEFSTPIPLLYGPTPEERPENATEGDNRDQSQLIVGDPVDASSGAFLWELPLVNLGGPLPLALELRYRSDPDYDPRRTPQAFPEKPGTTSGYASPWSLFPMPSLLLYGPNADLITLAGRRASFTLNPQSEWVLNSGTNNGVARDYQLVQDGEWYYAAESAAGLIYAFTSNEKRLTLRYIHDRNGNRLSYEYAHNLHTMPTAITDNKGRRIELEYSDEQLVTLRDHAGRTWTFAHDPAAADNDGHPVLRSVTDPMNRTHTFGYQTAETVWTNSAGHIHTAQNAYPLLASITDPRGNTLVRNEYILQPLNGRRPAPRVVSQLDARHARTTLSYEADRFGKYIATITWPDNTTDVYVHHSHNTPPVSHTDRSGHTIEFARSTNDQITAVKDRLGNVSTTLYHPASRQPAAIINPKGHRTDKTYSTRQQSFTNPENNQQYTFTFHDLVRVDHPDGAHETITRDTRGNITAQTDPAGHAMLYTHNASGQVLTQQNELGGTITQTYNPDGTLASSRDSDIGTTTYTYDTAKRLIRVEHPDGAFHTIAYDDRDRITSTTDELDQTTTFEYDENGNLLSITDPAGNRTHYTYDELDRVIRTVDRTDAESFVEYDVMSRPTRSTDASGVRLDQAYDPRGWLNASSEGGNTRTYEHDNEGLVVKETSPLGHETTTTRDRSGLPTAITDPLGHTTSFAYDKRNRLASVTDPLGRTTFYDRDGIGRITRVTLPGGNKVNYAYNPLGQIATLTDFNSATWQFDYTPMGRLASITDPLDRVTRHTYDERGRLATQTPPDGIRQTITYDAVGNMIRLAYHDAQTNPVAPHSLDFTYDPNNLLLTAPDITLTRDPEGRILDTTDDGLTYRATYDPAGRLASLSYANGALIVHYSYDTAPDGSGRLIAVSNNLTGTRVQLTHDADNRLTSIADASRQIRQPTRYYDDAGRLKQIISAEGHLEMLIERDAVGRIKSRLLTAPVTPTNAPLSIPHASFSYDAASQITSPGFTYDPRGRLTSISNASFSIPQLSFSYDAADRLTAIPTADLAYTYNGLGNLRTRTQNGQTTHYHYHHAIADTPILSERDPATGTLLRHYIWTPDGYLLHMIDATDANKVYFYHFDQIGNTLALSDQNGDITDAYAYDPYGHLIARTGENPQPFLYSGAWGVRAELLDDDFPLYDMRVRHYAPALQRFLTPEPVWPQLDHPLHLNHYQYAAHDPLGRYDATGLTPKNESYCPAVGVRIAFSSRYACAYNQAHIQEEIRKRQFVRDVVQKFAPRKGWSQERIDEYTEQALRWHNPNLLIRALDLGPFDPLELYAHTYDEDPTGSFGTPEWYTYLPGGREVLLGRGSSLRIPEGKVQNLVDLTGSGVLNVRMRVERTDRHGTSPWGDRVCVTVNRFRDRTFEEIQRMSILIE